MRTMRRTWTVIGVRDVARSLKWYQSLLALPESAPAHDHFGQVVDEDGTILLPNLSPNTGTMEFALRDPDGYRVMVSALS